eukprot:GHRR01012346.1.p1 GENE.GHRR01012346.1~~GHRR01012346.1.p1  ORF type:complete len:308 (+),score=60.64 GHRR01012346.1:171-1094(+)
MIRRVLAVVLAAMLVLAILSVTAAAETVGYGELQEEWRGEVQQLSWKPRAFLAKKFLSDEECEHIKRIAQPQLEESKVVDGLTGKSKKSEVRTSSGMFLSRGHDEVVSRIENRVAAVTMIPAAHQEGLQVLKYVNGQKYEPHYDYFSDAVNARPQRGGQRVVTVLMYLSTPEEGGETVFPDAERKVTGPGWSECALKGLANKPEKGDALMFYSLHPDGRKDPTSLHGSCPILKGEKWIHVGPFASGEPAPAVSATTTCVDAHDRCNEWAYFGECTRNPGYMLKGCKKSCKVCQPFLSRASNAHVSTS